VGEVNTGEDKAKIFPQEIMRLEEAPRKYTKQVHFRLNMAHLSEASFDSIQGLTSAHPGKCPLFLCFMWPTGERLFVEAHERFNVAPSLKLQQEADQLLGEETYYAKADLALPERAPKRWETRAGGQGDGE